MYKPCLLGFLLAVGACQSTSLRSGGRDGSADAVNATGGVTHTGGTVTTGGTPGTGGISASGGTGSSRVPIETGGRVGTGGVSGSGGIASRDASSDGRPETGVDVLAVRDVVETDTAGSSCEIPIPLRCGDRLNHSTLVQGRPDAWSTYGCTARWMSGRESLYAFQADSARTVTVRLKNATADLMLLPMRTCAMMSCANTPGSSQSFTVEAGSTHYLVVDGYDGAEGSYTLEVDCTNSTDAGPVDASRTDAPKDATPLLTCDAQAVSTVLSPLGIAALGSPRILNAGMPADLAADANWGLKATLCKEAGYDLSPAAGRMVCLIGQDITQRCQGNPATAWIVLNDGAVACVYMTVRQGYLVTPGVYAATDPACAQPVIAPGATVSCEGRSCSSETGPCCPATELMSRVGYCSASCFAAMTCDGPDDCAPGGVCCSLESTDGFAGTACVSASECVSPSRIICGTSGDCLPSQTCGKPNPMPVDRAASAGVTPVPLRINYNVCAP